MMTLIEEINARLANTSCSPNATRVYFKTGVGEYAEHDRFLGVKTGPLRAIAKDYQHLALTQVQELMESPFNEKRLLALYILVNHYQKEIVDQEDCYDFYIKNLPYINNWNLVDASAHWIVGAHLFNRDKGFLEQLANSNIMWERRVAMVATWYFIRHNSFEWTIRIAERLRNDKHDLIHKAVGWMLREVGKRNLQVLLTYLDQHASCMPRTMLRYSIEKLPAEQRQFYMQK